VIILFNSFVGIGSFWVHPWLQKCEVTVSKILNMGLIVALWDMV